MRKSILIEVVETDEETYTVAWIHKGEHCRYYNNITLPSYERLVKLQIKLLTKKEGE